jgi:transposase
MAMRQVTLLLTVTPGDLVPPDHPIRRIKPIVEQALAHLSPTFAQMDAVGGRPSIPPEHLLKASLLIALYSVRSERQFCERLRYDLLFKWFLDLYISCSTASHAARRGGGLL